MKRAVAAWPLRVAINTAWNKIPGIDNDYPVGSPRGAVSSEAGHAHASRWRFNRWQWEPVFLILFLWITFIGTFASVLFAWGGVFVAALIVAGILLMITRRVVRSKRCQRSP